MTCSSALHCSDNVRPIVSCRLLFTRQRSILFRVIHPILIMGFAIFCVPTRAINWSNSGALYTRFSSHITTQEREREREREPCSFRRPSRLIKFTNSYCSHFNEFTRVNTLFCLLHKLIHLSDPCICIY